MHIMDIVNDFQFIGWYGILMNKAVHLITRSSVQSFWCFGYFVKYMQTLNYSRFFYRSLIITYKFFLFRLTNGVTVSYFMLKSQTLHVYSWRLLLVVEVFSRVRVYISTYPLLLYDLYLMFLIGLCCFYQSKCLGVGGLGAFSIMFISF